MPRYGLDLINGREAIIDAPTIHAAMAEAEATYGAGVQRGRCLDGFDNDAPAGRPWYLEHDTRPPTLTRKGE
jgi:hypothetical protein